MRIAPVGLAFANCDKDDATMYRAVRAACLCTHVHPESLDAAFIQAKAVAILAKSDAKQFDALEFVHELQKSVKTATLQAHFTSILDYHAKKMDAAQVQQLLIQPNQFGKNFQIKAIDALATCLYSFVNDWNNPEQCLINCASLGGDADTTSCILGALLGALHGTSWIPARWFDQIENDAEIGRDALIDVAKQIALLQLGGSDIINDV